MKERCQGLGVALATPFSNDGGSFDLHNGRSFSTRDRDNDEWVNNCAQHFQAGWWYIGCYMVSIAGNNGGQVYWRNPNGDGEFVEEISMWVR